MTNREKLQTELRDLKITIRNILMMGELQQTEEGIVMVFRDGEDSVLLTEKEIKLLRAVIDEAITVAGRPKDEEEIKEGESK